MNFSDLGVWELLQKQMTFKQLGEISGVNILDFGSGNGAVASYYAEKNTVTAIEPDIDAIKNRIQDFKYTQIFGNITALTSFQDKTFDMIICHNVFEYAAEREAVMKEFSRLLKIGGTLSVLKHNRTGRVMQMTVLLNNFESANSLLDGNNSTAQKYGTINYYDDEDLLKWSDSFYIDKIFGQRTFWDLQQNQEIHKDKECQRKMLEIENRVSTIDEFKNIAFFHHIILKKK